MNILLWVIQILLSLHTIAGALWKFSNSKQTVPSLNAIPHGMWMVMSIIELLCAISLILPLLNKRKAILAPIAASFIVLEMLLFCGFNIFSGNMNYGQLIYWLVVAVISSFFIYGRLVLKPIQKKV